MKNMKKNKNEINDDERLETPFEVFKRNYKNVKGVRYFTRLFLYFFIVFFFFIISMLVVRFSNKEENNRSDVTTTKIVDKISYKEILEKNKNKSININIFEGDTNYIIDASINDNVVTGTYECSNGIKKFKIDNNIIYETKLNNLEENNLLFGNIDYNLFNINNLIEKLENNVGTKQNKDQYIVYNYNNIDNYNIEVILEDNNINLIKISNELYKYEITIK